jgi:hypothetical protein
MFNKISIVIFALILGACAARIPSEWRKAGATNADRDAAVAECKYQIQLNQTESTSLMGLQRLCMQGKGYVWVALNNS